MKFVTSVVALCIVVGFTAGSPVHATDVRPCPAQPLTVGELLALADDAGYAGFLGQLNPAGLACFGGSDVRVIGFVDEPEGLGGVSAIVIEPRWLTERGLFLHPSSAGTSDASGAFYAVAYPPGSGNPNRRYARRWVSLVAHFDDPAAQTCHAEGPADADPPTDEEAVAMCRQILVLSSIRVTSAPDTATAAAPADARGDVSALVFVAAGLLGLAAWAGRRRARPAA